MCIFIYIISIYDDNLSFVIFGLYSLQNRFIKSKSDSPRGFILYLHGNGGSRYIALLSSNSLFMSTYSCYLIFPCVIVWLFGGDLYGELIFEN